MSIPHSSATTAQILDISPVIAPTNDRNKTATFVDKILTSHLSVINACAFVAISQGTK